ncbi:uncharacterized protein UMAG_11229 [Mycosarcoma maydis]|uniref:Uncharacterized protein n=1 Tax=Mycosarcoma maydis TaxID=5270 RepID=A0A0D1DTB1_MYCMD|nr:uncharacterized protein UMAG_11229 [Ustilago maydis 521]KIS65835.1 hypothetical protein UMAG_11229 [Ustilago maydis 521]|eukprot:XP_011392628.1 hypothetical protein UMAG_11229 [Ustilago maydis 521]
MSAGDKIGGVLKGAIETIHGAGESIRGNINDRLDSAGEGLRSADSTNSTANASDPSTFGRSSDYNNSANHQDVAKNGSAEFKHGISKLQNAFSSNTTSSKPQSST